MKRSLVLFCIHLLFISLLCAQNKNKFTLSGYIKDKKTGEAMIGATVLVKEIPATGNLSNAYGYYSITLPQGIYTISIQFVGHDPGTQVIDLNQNIKQDFILLDHSAQLSEVTISSRKRNDNLTNVQMGIEKLNMEEIKNIPVLMGEKDIIKVIQLLPGIKSAGEGNVGFYVRGGASDQNLVLLDEANVYGSSHLLGFFSVFNSDAIKDVTVYKGEQPAEYGGRLSSVLDIKMNDGNNQKLGVTGGIGLISSRLTVEAPIVKDKGSFTISARRTYADLFLKLSSDTTLNKNRLYFYDLNMKANYTMNEKNRVYLSGYFGRDVLGFGNTFSLDWGNATGTVRWNHLFNDKLFLNTSLIFSNYDYQIKTDPNEGNFHITSKIQDYNLKQDYQFFAGVNSKIKFGFNSIYHTVVPGVITSAFLTTSTHLDNKYAWENAAYASHEFNLSKNFTVNYGLRVSSFSVLGPGSFYTYNSSGLIVDSLKYTGKFVKTYINLEPRLALNKQINERSSIKAAYDRNIQNMHLLSNSTSGNPTDLWIPSSNNVKPEIADQFSLGYYRNFKNNQFQFSTETYYKILQNQIDYRDGTTLRINQNAESDLLYGDGRAYGIEFLLKKKYGRFNGWVGYTLSRTEKRINGINNNKYYPAKQDRTHEISLVGIYNASKKWTVSSTFIYYTGNAVSFPSGKYEVNGQVINYYTERNGYRMPPYHRLDLGATYQRKKHLNFESSWTFSIYNVYARENAYTITFRKSATDPSKTEALQTSLFRIVPAITYNFKFL